MQKKILNIYWQPKCKELVPDVCDCLRKIFPCLDPVDAGLMEVQSEDYDPSRYQYDALCVLKHLSGNELAVWILSEDIYHPGYRYLYGAASLNKAVVSNFRPDTVSELLKEVCHEVGHAMGLKHCSEKCLMHVSRSGKQLEKKPLQLCLSCQHKIEKQSASIPPIYS